MKVLHAYNQHRGGGGADNAARATIESSRQNGVEVEVYTRNSEDLPGGLRGRVAAAAAAFGAAESVHRFDARIDSFRPDLVHVHEVFPLVSPWILPLCSRRGIPVVATCVDYRMTCPVVTHLLDGEICARCTGGHEYHAVLRNCRGSVAESVIVALYNTAVRKFRLYHDHVARFIAPSAFTRDWLISKGGLDPSRVTAISPVVAIPEDAVDPSRGGYVAFAGRFAAEKGIDVLLQAARLSGLPVRLCRDARSLVTVPIPEWVEVVVTRTREELEAFYRGARMLVFPSPWFETFGLVPAEAMSHGVPVIVTRLGAMTELVRDGVDGLLFERGVARDLAAKMQLLWDDPGLCRRMGREARQRAASSWSARRHFEHLARTYAEVCRGD